MYTQQEFISWYGKKEGMRRWNAAAAATSKKERKLQKSKTPKNTDFQPPSRTGNKQEKKEKKETEKPQEPKKYVGVHADLMFDPP